MMERTKRILNRGKVPIQKRRELTYVRKAKHQLSSSTPEAFKATRVFRKNVNRVTKQSIANVVLSVQQQRRKQKNLKKFQFQKKLHVKKYQNKEKPTAFGRKFSLRMPVWSTKDILKKVGLTRVKSVRWNFDVNVN